MSKELPLVCICIPTYNAAATIKETLESILAQSYSNIVIHVSDNASSDETIRIIESIADHRVNIHRYTENVGGEGNFNRCIQLAEGKYTAIFHADDIYEPNMVAKQVAFFDAHPEAGALFTEASLINEFGNRIGDIRLPQGIVSQRDLYDFTTMFKAILRHSNFFICPSVMVPTEVYQQEIKSWRGEMFKSSADLDVWLRILQRHLVGHLKEPLMCYRISSNQWSASVRLGTERADFFLVTDYYLAQEYVRSFLTVTDMSNYRNLERRDRVMRAVNLYLSGRLRQANDLIADVFSLDALKFSLKSKHGMFVLFVGIYLKLIMLLGLNRVGNLSLSYMKNVTRK